MFWTNLLNLCNEANTTPTAVVKELGIAAGSVTKWKNGSAPRGTTLQKLANYFSVSVEYLLGKADQKEKPADEGELSENVVIYHRDGKTVKRSFTKEQLALFHAMLDAIPEDPNDNKGL